MSQTDTSDLSNRIMAAWLKANPRPDIVPDTWIDQYATLKAILALEAYESAVIQFLLPDGFRNDFSVQINPMAVYMDGKNFRAHVGGWKGRGSGASPAEALLNAIEAAEGN